MHQSDKESGAVVDVRKLELFILQIRLYPLYESFPSLLLSADLSGTWFSWAYRPEKRYAMGKVTGLVIQGGNAVALTTARCC